MPPVTPSVKVPVPAIVKPVADSVDLKTPKMAVLNCPAVARYTPVFVSLPKFSDGVLTEPSAKLKVVTALVETA